jgi:hypothetical protein
LSEEQPENTDEPPNAIFEIRFSWESDSNVTFWREMHAAKESDQRISTDAGMQIDLSDEHSRNAQEEMSFNREFGSNVTFSREMQPLKEHREISPTDCGIQIDLRDMQQENVPLSN